MFSRKGITLNKELRCFYMIQTPILLINQKFLEFFCGYLKAKVRVGTK